MWSERVYTEAVKRTAGLNKKRDVLLETARIIRRKNMKVLMINGSPHKEGNTYIALKEMEKIFSEDSILIEISVNKSGSNNLSLHTVFCCDIL